MGRGVVGRAHLHGAELVKSEVPPVDSDPLLGEENRAEVIDEDGDGQNDEQRREDNQPYQGKDEINSPFQESTIHNYITVVVSFRLYVGTVLAATSWMKAPHAVP